MGYNTPQGFLQGGTAYTTNAAGEIIPARVGFGSVVLASGIGTLGFGFPILTATCSPRGTAGIGNGTLSGAHVDSALFASGSVIVRGLAGTLIFNAAGTVDVIAFGG
jgi:hypothetical protein